MPFVRSSTSTAAQAHPPPSRSRAPEASPPARYRRHDRAGVIVSGRLADGARELDDAITASAHQRTRDRDAGVSSRMATAQCAGLRCFPRSQQGALAWSTRFRQYWKRGAEAHRRHLAHAGDAVSSPAPAFVGTLAELVFAADRSYMLIGSRQGDNRGAATIELSAMNFGPYPMSHGLTRLQSRFQAIRRRRGARRAKNRRGARCRAAEALGLVHLRARRYRTGTTRSGLFFEERTSFSPDSLTGMEANLRFVGPRPWNQRSSRA